MNPNVRALRRNHAGARGTAANTAAPMPQSIQSKWKIRSTCMMRVNAMLAC